MVSVFNSTSYYVNEDNVEIRRTFKRGHSGFFCKKCFHPIIVRLNIEYDSECDNDLHFWVENRYSFACPECGTINRVNYEIDPNITPTIALLNKKGYKTEFCCEGHYTEEGMDNAYIYFAKSVSPDILINNPLPYPWFRDTEIQKDVDCSKELIIRCYTNIYKTDKRMAIIYKWAEGLPEYKMLENNES